MSVRAFLAVCVEKMHINQLEDAGHAGGHRWLCWHTSWNCWKHRLRDETELLSHCTGLGYSCVGAVMHCCSVLSLVEVLSEIVWSRPLLHILAITMQSWVNHLACGLAALVCKSTPNFLLSCLCSYFNIAWPCFIFIFYFFCISSSL